MESGQHSDVNELTTSRENFNSNQNNSPPRGKTIDAKVVHETKGEIVNSLLSVLYIYRQDVVRSKINSKVGIVTEVAGDSDSDSSLTDDEDDGDRNNDQVGSKEGEVEEKGNSDKKSSWNTDRHDSNQNSLDADQVRVLWMDESDTIENSKDVTVIDRGLLHGDYVAAGSDPMGQIGIVVDVNITVDLLAHDGSILKDTPSKDLKRIREFTVGDHVVLGQWLGRIEDIFDNVTVLFDDGSVCKVMKAEPLRLKPVGKSILDNVHFPYYPGQRVKASSSSVFKNSRWLSGLWKANRLEGTVIKVSVGTLFIYWIASAGYGPDSSTTPAEEQSPRNLNLLSCFAHTNWQLGDWCLLPSSPGLAVIPRGKGESKLEYHGSSKDETETPEAVDESDVEVSNTELTGDKRPKGNCLEASLTKTVETSENNTPAEPGEGSSAVSDSKGAGHDAWPLHRKKIRKVVVKKDKRARKKIENFERALQIISTKTKVDVAWQDGTINRGLDSISLIPITSPGDHDFVAEQYVTEKAADDNDGGLEVRCVGVVKWVNAKDKTVCVQWLKPISKADDARDFDEEEVVSAYELEGHLDYDYCYGDVVVRLSPVSLPDKMDSFVHSVEDRLLGSPKESKQDKGKHHGSKNTENVSSLDMSTDFSDLSWVGNITGLKDGGIEVTWADGMISTVGPQAIYVVGRDDDESIIGGSFGSDDAASWETIGDENLETIDKDLRTVNASDVKLETEDSDTLDGHKTAEDAGSNGTRSIPLAALGFVTKLASGIFSVGQKPSGSDDMDTKSEDNTQFHKYDISDDPAVESCSQNPEDVEHQLSEITTESKEGGDDASEVTDLLACGGTCNIKPPQSDDLHPPNECKSTFKSFDIVQDPSDHHFLSAMGQSNTSRKWLKKVQQDWSILQNNLPEGIFVCAYEDRMDLLRAVIVGAYGTPYQDGLFFFDFLLPPEYPDVPPSAYYHSGGWRINPNLYEEGRVCLSLLNTWTGRRNEVWDPSTSSILQVLVSLQGLVLNSKPYFNEAGYDKQVGTAEGEKNSLSYNENTFLVNCKTMMYLMRKPPKHFEEFITEHFRKQGYYILKACDAYMKGHLIGSLTRDASITDDSGNSNSVGFKLMLGKLVPRLFSALCEVGANCQEFKHLLES